MYQQWTPPQRSRRELRQLALKRRALKRRFWQFSASVCLFSFLFVQEERLDYGHILPYLPTEVTGSMEKARELVSGELAFFQRVFQGETSKTNVREMDSSQATSNLSEGSELSYETEEVHYQESMAIFASQGNQLWTDMLELVEGGNRELEIQEENYEENHEETGEDHLETIPEKNLEEIFEEIFEEIPEEPQEEALWETIYEIGDVLEYVESTLPESHTENHLYLGEGSTAAPVDNVVTSTFGLRTHPLTGEPAIHNGVDLRSGEGVSIAAWREGVVSVVGYTAIVGNYLRIDHGNEIFSFYAHCKEVLVEKGDVVALGEEIARVGATGDVTGPHLHFEITHQGVYLNPLYYIEHRGILD